MTVNFASHVRRAHRFLLPLGITLGVVLLLLFAYGVLAVGVPASFITTHERAGNGIPADWPAVTAETDGVYAAAFLGPDGEGKLVAYVRQRGGLGWFFRLGMNLTSVPGSLDCAWAVPVVGQLVVFAPPETCAWAAAVCEAGRSVTEADPAAPFLYVTPKGCTEVQLLGADGSVLAAYPCP